MSKDQMQDVFAVEFDWKKGERVTAEKLTGWVKQTDSAFSEMTQAIGDPWEFQNGVHLHPLGPEKLTQASLARFLGPADWVSPHGASWNESSTAKINLSGGRNSWSLGFPLVSVGTTLTPESPLGSISDLTGSNINIDTDNQSVLVTEKSTPEEVAADGDFYIDYKAGLVTAYKITTDAVVLTVSGLYMFGAGVPWGTANVIPTWKQTTGLVNITEEAGSPSGGLSTYLVELPTVNNGTRSTGSLSGSDGVEYDGQSAPGSGQTQAKYRLPYALTNAFSSGEIVPEGFVLLWDNTLNRVVPNVEFYYEDEYTLKLVMIESALDGSLGENFRLITTGTSVSEAVNHLMNSTRSNNHSGMTAGQDGKTLAYFNPLSHKDLANRWGGEISSPDSAINTSALQFRESSYPTNDHPQYIHRAGYMTEDQDGNSANSMRGDIVFSAVDTYLVGASNGGLDSETYGIKFGSGYSTAGSIYFSGGASSTEQLGFGVDGVGLVKTGSTKRGTVSYEPYADMPFYFKSNGSDEYSSGGSIAFDYMNSQEMNYMKVHTVERTGANDVAHLSADMGQSNPSVPYKCMPSLLGRPQFEQFREFRFRGVSYIPTAANDGLTTSGDFDKYFTSPGIVGADFLNVYSNAIFFSQQGDGKVTSLHEIGKWWALGHYATGEGERPIGLYYNPVAALGSGGEYELVAGSSFGTTQVARIGNQYVEFTPTVKFTADAPTVAVDAGDFNVTCSGSSEHIANQNITFAAGPHGSAIEMNLSQTGSFDVSVVSGQKMSLYGSGTSVMELTTAGRVRISSTAGQDTDITASADINMTTTTGDINITPNNNFVVQPGFVFDIDLTNLFASLRILDIDTSVPSAPNTVYSDGGTLKITPP